MLGGIILFRAALLLPLLVSQLSLKAITREALRDLAGGLREGLPLMIGEFCLLGVFMADRYAVDIFVGHETTGVYTMAVTLARATAVLTAPVFMIVRPEMLALWQRGRVPGALRQMAWAFRYTVMALIACALTAALNGAEILAVIRPVYRTSGQYLPLLALAYTACPLIFMPGAILLAKRKIWTLTAAALAALCAAAAGQVILVPRGGPFAAAGVTMFAYSVWLAALCWAARSELKQVVDGRFLWRLLFPAALLAALLLTCRRLQGWRLIAAVACAWAVYGVLIWRMLGLPKRPEPAGAERAGKPQSGS